MESVRKPFQGVANVVRFNWHFYLFAFVISLTLFSLALFINRPISLILNLFIFGIIVTVSITLLVTFYVYDLSNLYKLNRLKHLQISNNETIININAGFDETSELIKSKFKPKNLIVLDFYDETKHTEISIKRARKAYPPYPNTLSVTTNSLPLENNLADKVFCFLSVHEIRDNAERVNFFKELNRVLKSKGQIIVTEHLRDLPNFLAYNIGFFHFHSKKIWSKTFTEANFVISEEIKITPFISTFILEKNGISS